MRNSNLFVIPMTVVVLAFLTLPLIGNARSSLEPPGENAQGKVSIRLWCVI